MVDEIFLAKGPMIFAEICIVAISQAEARKLAAANGFKPENCKWSANPYGTGGKLYVRADLVASKVTNRIYFANSAP